MSDDNLIHVEEYEDLEQAEESPNDPLAVNARDTHGWTLLMRAAVLGDCTTIMHLMSYSADLDARQSNGTTALMLAVQHAKCPTAAALLKEGARINEEDNQGETALIKAIKRGDKEMLKLILENGANYTVGKSAGFNAIQLAEVLGSQEIRTTLIDYITNFEKPKQVSWFDYEQLKPLGPGMGFILFIGTTKANNHEVTCKLKGHRAVTAVHLNGVPQRCLSAEGNSVMTFKPVKEGKNELVICFNTDTTSSAKLVVRAYKAQLFRPDLQS
ncbi:hypothetical protein BaRGS_00038604 [Batillaria attramentaria]|uniref:Uncharacterized protein n=1 Tax=Batillaria attramentaria TaxID=370345 RepID=A0ABD0J5N1_9CAEN